MRFDNFIWRWEYALEERREVAASLRYLWSQALYCLALAILRLCRGHMFDAPQQFRGAILAAGLTPPAHIEPGKFHRFPGAGKNNGNAAGWCKLLDDCQGGVYGDFSTGLSTHWQIERATAFTQAQRQAFMRQVSEMKAHAEAERQAAQAKTAEKAAAIWQAAEAASDHPYLTRKGIRANGARLHNGALVIPVRDGGELHSLQFIDANGEKRFLSDGRKKGCYFSMGTTSGAAALCIAEGFATGATIHEATGLPVAVAFDAGNLESVALSLRAKLHELPLILCADDDAATEGNPGIAKATAAAQLVGGKLAIPDFGGNRPHGAKDFNDMAAHCGAEAVRMAVSRAIEPDTPTQGPDTPGGAQSPLEGARIIALTIDELLKRDFPPMVPLLAPWLCKQHVSMVYAWRGVGKTHFALGVAYAVAGGGHFLKWKADSPRRVVYIDGEMAGAAIQARLAAIVESSPDEFEPPEGHFKIITPDTQELPLPDLAAREGQEALWPHIADADLIVIDNLSTLMRAGAENEGESWVPVSEWALAMRKAGKAVLFVHHAGKAGQQRGSSRREDLMDVVIKLEHAKDYEAEKGAAFLVNFEKARHLTGDDARDIEAALIADEGGRQNWVWKDAELGTTERILAMKAEFPDLNQSDIATELGVHRSTVNRALKKVGAPL